MSNYYDLCEWQLIDPSNKLVKPWFAHPFLEVLDTWDLKDKIVLEYGAGKSTPWWAEKAKLVCSVEANEVWDHNVRQWLHDFHLLEVVKMRGVYTGECDRANEHQYVHAGDKHGPYDIVVVDGIFRYECMVHGIELLQERGGKLIVDNWQQDGFICPACEVLMSSYPGRKYIQPDHTDHNGHPWSTAYWDITTPMPDDFRVTDDYNSHRPMLWMALQQTQGVVLELGSGNGSTQLLHNYCQPNRWFFSYETNRAWADKFEGITFHIAHYHGMGARESFAVLFIDSAPGEERADLVEEYRNKAQILIIHDTEPGAEYVYHIQEVLNSFPYRCDLVVPGYPQTTAVSMTVDVSDWKGIFYGEYKFV